MRTPDRPWQPYVESPIEGKEPLPSPGFKGKACGVGTRKPLQRTAKDLTNYFRLAHLRGKDMDPDQVGLSAEGDMGEDTDETEDEDESLS